MIDCLSIVEIDKVIHTMETDIVKLVVEIESFSMSSDEFDKETRSSDRLPPRQADLNCVHALNKLHLHEICVVPTANPVEAKKLRIQLNFEAAIPVETEKLRIRLNFETANPIETEKPANSVISLNCYFGQH
ncbi:hypothetical protein Tco_0995184 [Tanacetum coccineum]